MVVTFEKFIELMQQSEFFILAISESNFIVYEYETQTAINVFKKTKTPISVFKFMQKYRISDTEKCDYKLIFINDVDSVLDMILGYMKIHRDDPTISHDT